MKINSWDLMRKGGKWLGVARNYLIWNVPNGDRLIWGSNEVVTITVKQIEEMAAEIAASIMNGEN